MFKGIVIACDVPFEKLPVLARSTGQLDGVAGFKIGSLLALEASLRKTVAEINTLSDKPVIYDHQKAGTDIPQMAEPLLSMCARSGARGTIIFPFAGPDTLRHWCRAWRRLTQNCVHDLIVGAVMTHPEFLVSEGGFLSDDMPKRVFTEALKCGVRSFVLPATKLHYATVLWDAYNSTECPGFEGEPINVYTPGLGRQQAEVDEAKIYIGKVPPFDWYPIIGSAIYGAEDPTAAAKEWIEKLKP